MFSTRIIFKKKLAVAVMLCAFSSHLVAAGQHVEQMKTDILSWAPWSKLPVMEDVRNNVTATLVSKLGLSKEFAENVPLSRVFTSEWYQVKVDNKVYVVDQHAKYWLLVDGNVNFFMFDKGIQSINVSNRARDSMLNAGPLFEQMLDTMVVYPSLNGSRREIVYVFMDLSCPHSKSFHLTRRQELQLAGFEFRYIPFAALRKSNQIESMTRFIWCGSSLETKRELIDKAYMSANTSAAHAAVHSSASSCSTTQKNALKIFETFTENHQLSGTPVFLNESGILFYGVASFERGNLVQPASSGQ